MTLTKKHFEAIAEILNREWIDRAFFRETKEEVRAIVTQRQYLIDSLMNRLSDYFETQNPSFDRQLFKAAVFDGKIGLKDAKRKKVNE